MEKQLNAKEQKIIEHFAKVGLTKMSASQVTMGAAKDLYNIKDPLIFKIGNTNNMLVFGEIRKSMSFDQMRSWIEEQLKNSKMKSGQAGSEIEGESRAPINELDGEVIPEPMDEEVKSEQLREDEEDLIKDEDVNLIVEQAKLSREDAIQELKKANYDVFAALVNLSKNK